MCAPDEVEEVSWNIRRQALEYDSIVNGTYNEEEPNQDLRVQLILRSHAFGRSTKAENSLEERHLLHVLAKLCFPPRDESEKWTVRDPFDPCAPGYDDAGMEWWRDNYEELYNELKDINLYDEEDIHNLVCRMPAWWMARLITEFLPKKIDWDSWIARKYLAQLCLSNEIPIKHMRLVPGFRFFGIGEIYETTNFGMTGISGKSMVCVAHLPERTARKISKYMHGFEVETMRRWSLFIIRWLEHYVSEQYGRVYKREEESSTAPLLRRKLTDPLSEYYCRSVLGWEFFTTLPVAWFQDRGYLEDTEEEAE